MIRTLAEPNLTAISGESANFLAGGEFPIPAGYTCTAGTAGAIGNCQYQIQFKKFGVSLNFTPVVLAGGRISLRVLTEVSELSTENQLTVAQAVTLTTSMHAHHSLDQDPPCGDHGRASLRRRTRHGRHDPGADQAAGQRHSRLDAVADSRRPVQEPRLHQQAVGAHGHRHAVRGEGGGAKGAVAAGRWVRRLERSGGHPARQIQSHLRPRKQGRPEGRSTTASPVSFSTERSAPGDDRCPPFSYRSRSGAA